MYGILQIFDGTVFWGYSRGLSSIWETHFGAGFISLPELFSIDLQV